MMCWLTPARCSAPLQHSARPRRAAQGERPTLATALPSAPVTAATAPGPAPASRSSSAASQGAGMAASAGIPPASHPVVMVERVGMTAGEGTILAPAQQVRHSMAQRCGS